MIRFILAVLLMLLGTICTMLMFPPKWHVMKNGDAVGGFILKL